MDITITVESIDDILPIDRRSLSLELSGVNLDELVKEITVETLLEEIGTEAIEAYLKSIDEDENGETA